PMFEGIHRGLSDALKMLRGRGRLTEANIRDGLREVRRALLDADVNFEVAQEFIRRVTDKAVGQDVLKRIDPSEQIIQIVYEELVNLMGPVDHNFRFAKDRPTVIMLCGLQGSGKTTTAGKLALTLHERGRKPLLVGADLQRPAAIEQIKVLGEQIKIPVYSETGVSPVQVCRNALAHAGKQLLDTVILDTAGRLHIDEMPMDELRQIDKQCKPDQILLVCDAMTGQDAVHSSKAFNEALELDGVILTKLDGDARGGAALSIKEVTKVPIKWIGIGEKLDALQEFHAERMAQRIMGQGDLMSIIDKVAKIQQEVSAEEQQEMQEKLKKGDFTLDDFRKQFEQMAKMGGMGELMKSMPGMGEMIPEGEDPEKALTRIQGMIDSMTKKEKGNPDIIDLSRRRRIAAGAGVEPHEVKQFLNQFDQVRTLMRQMANMSIWERIKMATNLNKMGAFLPGSNILKKKGSTVQERNPRELAEERKKKRKAEKKSKKRNR
ncbi:MAG: signal recognition particle protein, partial [Gemmataceae bacterium]